MHLYVIYSAKAYHLVYYPSSGNYPTSVQFRRNVLIIKSPTIDQSRFITCFAGLEIIFLGDTYESLCWALHLNHFMCYQVSILGPLLFLVYVNDLPKSTSNNTIVTMFADDTKCRRALQHPNDNKILQSDLDKITDWCHVWRMSLNQSKHGVLHFSTSQQPATAEYTLLGKPVKHTCSQKDLGI